MALPTERIHEQPTHSTDLERADEGRARVTEPEADQRPEKKKSRKVLYGTIAGVAGAAIAAGAIMGISAANAPNKSNQESSAPATPSTPEASAPPAPAETAAPLTVEAVEFKAGMTPEQLGTAFVQRMSDWEMAGANDANYKIWQQSNGVQASLDYVGQVAQQDGTIYAEALFGKNWQSRPDVNGYVPRQITQSSENILLHFQTAPGNDRRDKAQFTRSFVAGTPTIVSHAGDTIVEQIPFTDVNNANMNRADQLSSSSFSGLNGTKEIFNVTFTNVNGVEIITNLDIQFAK